MSTPLQSAIDQAIAHLTRLREYSICRESRIDADDASSIAGLKSVAYSVAMAVDHVLVQIAYEAGLSDKRIDGDYASITFNAVFDNLGCILNKRADDLNFAAALKAKDANDEHRPPVAESL